MCGSVGPVDDRKTFCLEREVSPMAIETFKHGSLLDFVYHDMKKLIESEDFNTLSSHNGSAPR